LTKTKSVTALAILSLLIALGTTVLGPSRSLSGVVASASGHIVKLEAWHFKAAPVRHDLPNRPWARRLEKWLPNPVKQRMGLLRPVVTAVAEPTFPGEPVLSAAFSIRDPSGSTDLGALRVIVLDDRGEAFDPAAQNLIANSGYWVTECATGHRGHAFGDDFNVIGHPSCGWLCALRRTLKMQHSPAFCG
jgi:hypothetical protein